MKVKPRRAAAYLRSVGPTYGFFGLGLSLYFASQGAGRLFWPLFAGMLRLLIAVSGGWAVLRLTGSLGWLFAALGAALVVYGMTLATAIALGPCRGGDISAAIAVGRSDSDLW